MKGRGLSCGAGSRLGDVMVDVTVCGAPETGTLGTMLCGLGGTLVGTLAVTPGIHATLGACRPPCSTPGNTGNGRRASKPGNLKIKTI